MSPSELKSDDIVELMPLLRVYAVFLTKSATYADDIVQDTLERAWRSRTSFKEGSNVKAWMFGILRNCFIDGLRKDKRLVQDVDGKIAAALSTPAEQHWRLQYAQLLRAIEGLPPQVRDAVFLVIGAGLSHEEAAAVLGCPLGTLKSRVRRARGPLMDMIDIEPAR
jgi:RNA polymerase sigma-70 factor (ECF subfamily)